MGSWELKDNLDPLECLQIELGLANDEDQWRVEDFIAWDTKTNTLSECDREHIYLEIRKGVQSGEVNDWDPDFAECQGCKKTIFKNESICGHCGEEQDD